MTKKKKTWKEMCGKLRKLKLPKAKIHKSGMSPLSDESSKSSYLESKGWEKVYHKGKFLGWFMPDEDNLEEEFVSLFPLWAAVEIQEKIEENDISYTKSATTFDIFG